jgi:hypothetical protein
MEAMDKAGVRGIRVNLEPNGVTDPAAAAATLTRRWVLSSRRAGT